jgi:hypothetical protein
MSVVGPTIRLVPTVFMRESAASFHRTEDCQQLLKRPARGNPHPVVEVDLADLNFVRPCRNCYPDAPRIKVVRRFCPLCNKSETRPCRHNGGVPVTIGRPIRYISLLRDPGDEQNVTIYVWPDQVHFYEPVA